MKRRVRWWLAPVVGALAVALGASIAMAAELDDGSYTLTIPGVGDFEFEVDSDGEEPVTATAAPEGYAIDDDDPDKTAWKNAASLEVEVKTDKVEADVDWTAGDGSVTLNLPGGGTITISEFNAADGSFTVTADGGWFAFGGGKDWYVANDQDIEAADKFLKVEANSDGIEIIAVDEVDDGFLNDLDDEDDEEEEELEEEEEEQEEEELEEDEDDGPPEGRGRP